MCPNNQELHKTTEKLADRASLAWGGCLGEGGCGLWSSDVPSAPLCSGPPVEPAVGLTDGRGRLRLAEEALAALHDETSQYAGFDLLQVVRLGADFGLKEVDVGLIPGLLLRTEQGGGKRTDVQI